MRLISSITDQKGIVRLKRTSAQNRSRGSKPLSFRAQRSVVKKSLTLRPVRMTMTDVSTLLDITKRISPRHGYGRRARALPTISADDLSSTITRSRDYG